MTLADLRITEILVSTKVTTALVKTKRKGLKKVYLS